jgi:hypothetical protein
VALVFEITAGNNTVGAAGDTVTLSVYLGNDATPIVGETITWAVTSGDATLSSPTSETDVDGIASVVMTFGSLTSTISADTSLAAPEVFTEYGQTNYNCACDDSPGSKTLLQLRTELMIRLGFALQVDNPPPGMTILLNSFLQEAQELAITDYKVPFMERFFTWQMEPGVRFYDLEDNLYECAKQLDPRMLTWVGISQDGNFWRRLISGINPEMYYAQISGWPQYYEIRQCIEVWPPPADATWQLRIKGYFGLLDFTADSDVCSIDHRAISLLALANAKAHYGQPDAANYAQRYRSFIGSMTAGAHGLQRFIPGGDQTPPPPLPILTGYPGDP